MNKPRILLVDNDYNYCQTTKHFLLKNGYEVEVALTAKHALDVISANCPDLVLIETVLPDVDGTDVIRTVRENSILPIIVVSARLRERDKVVALDLGADDYIIKPFNCGELLARIRTAFRHASLAKRANAQNATCTFHLRNLKVDYINRKVFIGQTEIHLTPHEYTIVNYLSQNLGQVVSYKTLMHKVWTDKTVYDNAILRVHMNALRKKIEPNPSKPEYLFTEAGVGYRLK